MHYKTLLRSLVPVLFVSFVAWPACQKNEFEDPELAERTSEFAFPLFSTTLNLKDLMLKVLSDSLSNDTILVNPDGTMTLYYSGKVAEKPATDIFKDFAGGLFPLTDTVSYGPIDNLPGVSVSRADLSKGTIYFGIFNGSQDTLTGHIRIPQMTKDGNVFVYPFVASPGANNATPIPVAGYILQSNNNVLEFIYEAYKPTGERVKVEIAPGFPGIFVQFENLEFSYLQGYWANQRYELIRDTIEIDINQTNLVGDVYIKNPQVTMRIANSWGFPTRGVVKYLSFIGRNGEEIPLTSSVFVDSAVDFNYPSFALGEVGQTKFTDITLDETNSNIAQIFNSQPTRLIYEVDGISNAQNDQSIVGFLTDSSNISLNMRVELLLEGSARNFGAEQTLDLNFGGLTDLDTSKLESVEFKIVSENGSPISSNLQLYFLDEAGVAVDSLFDNGAQFIIRAAPVNSEGAAIGITRTEHFVTMPAARFERVRQTKQAYLSTAFTTAQDGAVSVRLLASDNVTVKMGIKAKMRFQ
ncbi:MAG: hypothetical protein KF734_12035 [Saprospiraceae bacterium]|nr:hypothetical protein [Saprospiraceae bacterium]